VAVSVRRASTTLLVLNLAAVWLVWGSTAPAIRVAVATLPPFVLIGARFLCAGAVLWTYVRLRGVPMPSQREWAGAVLVGIMLLVLGNGLFAWSLQYLNASVGALFFSLTPLLMALFAFAFEREPLTRLGAAGLLLGFAGMAYLLAPAGAASLPLMPVLAGLVSAVAWALGSILQRKIGARDLVQSSAMQMLAAGLAGTVVAFATGERLTATAPRPEAIGAFFYLVVFGSIVGYSCYLWLMRNASTTLASTYAYVNPIVAIALSAVFLHEPLTPRLLIAASVIVLGVALMMLAPRPLGAHAEPAEPLPLEA
jgi:drug/metabolite transporter (DMT)-like permease